MRQRTVVAAGLTVVLLGGLGVAEVAHARLGSRSGHPASRSVSTGPVDTLRWGPCTSFAMAAEVPLDSKAVCSMVSVPLDYADPAGTHIKVAVSMVRHTAAAASYQGAILVNPGGPGQPGLGLSSTGARVPDHVGADYDWIGFDPRGVGASVPALTCEANYFTGPRMPYAPATPEATTAWLNRAAAYATSCGQHSGQLIDHMTTADSARDMDAIRKALGQKEISYYGYSYGTYLGQVYATLFPTHLHRLVLDSNVDPRHVWYQGNLDQDPAFEANLDAWFAWLARYDDTYHLGRTEASVRSAFYAAQDQLDAHPADAIGGDEWNDVFAFAGYSQSAWAALGTVFADWVNSSNDLPLRNASRDVIADYATSYPGYLAVSCTDSAWPKSVAKNLADTRQMARTARYLTWQNMWFNAPCLTWPAAPHTPVTVNGSAVRDALLVDQTHDAATPYEGSLEVRRLFPHAVLLALPGGTSHADSLSGDDCEDTTIADYLATGALPARKPGTTADSTCQPPALPIPRG